MFITRGSGDTQRLTTETANILKGCERISYGSESGWTVAYGFDEYDNLKIAVHANSEEEIKRYLRPRERFVNEYDVTTWGSIRDARA